MKKHRPRHRNPKPRSAQAAPAERRSDEAVYHGGAPGVGVGDFLLPRNLTGNPGSRSDWPEQWVQAAGLEDYDDGDWVFVTKNFKLAVRCAVVHRSGRGQVYEVIPEGKIEADPALVQLLPLLAGEGRGDQGHSRRAGAAHSRGAPAQLR